MLRWFAFACVLLGVSAWYSPARADSAPLPFSLEAHKQNYFLVTWDFEPHADRQDKEIKFQLSIKKRLLESTPIYAAYTQTAEWQWFNRENSRPFRTQTHNPEVFVDSDLDTFMGGMLGIKLGGEHESNGQSTAGSHSWDRLYVWPRITFADWENLTISAKTWWRLPEDKKKNPEDPNGDDNPDIIDYMGHGELYITQFSQGPKDDLPYRRVSLMLRKGTKAGTGTGQLDLDYNLHDLWDFFNAGIYLHFQYFYGYGESLTDYNRLVKKVGLGFSFY
jgi:phospholipase A1